MFVQRYCLFSPGLKNSKKIALKRLNSRGGILSRGNYFGHWFQFIADIACLFVAISTAIMPFRELSVWPNDMVNKITRVNPICVSSHIDGLSMSNLNKQLSLMQQAHIQWTRFDFAMNVIEPSQEISSGNIMTASSTQQLLME